jgi:hypothetical protein
LKPGLDAHGHEVDLLVDLGTRRIPIEIQAGSTVAADAYAGLDYFAALSGAGEGILVHGGDEDYRRPSHRVRPWHARS